MEAMPQQTAPVDLIALALRDLAEGRDELLASALEEMHPADVAALLEGLPPEPRRATWSLVAEEHRGEVLAYVHDEARSSLIGEMQPAELVARPPSRWTTRTSPRCSMRCPRTSPIPS